MQKTVKCMIVGDSETGKTLLFCRMTGREIPKAYEPTVFEVVNKDVEWSGEIMNVTLWDSAGSPLYDSIRPISYAHTDCFVICFSKQESSSLSSIIERWHPEIIQYGDGPTVPIILVETKVDLYPSQRELEVDQVMEKVKAHALFRTSSLDEKLTSSSEDILAKAVELAWAKKVEEEKPPNPIWNFHNLTIIVAGDLGVGKTTFIQNCIIQKPEDILSQKKEPRSLIEHQKQHSCQEHYHDLLLDGTEYFIRLVEVQLESGSEAIQHISKEADALILCYAVNDPFSFQSADSFCRSELGHLRREGNSKVPIILIGTKSDLKEASHIIIPTEDGAHLCTQMKLDLFKECSGKSPESQDDFVQTLVDLCKHNCTVPM